MYFGSSEILAFSTEYAPDGSPAYLIYISDYDDLAQQAVYCSTNFINYGTYSYAGNLQLLEDTITSNQFVDNTRYCVRVEGTNDCRNGQTGGSGTFGTSGLKSNANVLSTYRFNTGTTTNPSTSQTSYFRLSTALSAMTTGGTYSMMISNTDLFSGNTQQTNSSLDTVESYIERAVGQKASIPPSSQVVFNNANGYLIADILYNTQTASTLYNYTSYQIRVSEKSGNFFNDDSVNFGYTYYGYTGDDGLVTAGAQWDLTKFNTGAFSPVESPGYIYFDGGTELSATTQIIIATVDNSGDDFYGLIAGVLSPGYGYITVGVDGTTNLSVMQITSGSTELSGSNRYAIFNVSTKGASNYTFTTERIEKINVSFSKSGANGTSGSSGKSGSSGTSGSSGSSGTSGSSGSSGTSGVSGTSGSSGTSGTATITNLGDNRVLTSTGVQGQANAEANLTFDGNTLRVTGDTFITSNITVDGSATILTDTYSTAFVLQPTLVNVGNITNGTLFMDVRNLIGQSNTFLLMGEGFATDNIQGQQWGNLYCLSGNSSSGRTWVNADASAVPTSTGLLGVGIIDNDTGAGLLLRGFININSSYFTGTDIPGAPLYMSITGGRYSFDPPTSTGEIVRVVGYFNQAFQDGYSDILYNIYFNPSNDWIEL
jgi:hypothetical protein